jgi:multiple antibiotic resistance protein
VEEDGSDSAAILITAAICHWCWEPDSWGGGWARPVGILVRIMGLLLVALAVQYFVNGMVDLGVITVVKALRA